MGGSTYSHDSYTSSAVYSSARVGESTRSAASVAAAAKSEIVSKLSPRFKNKAGQIIRESRDSTEKPNSNAVAVFLDVTGSNYRHADKMIKNLGALMASLTADGVLPDPHVLFGCLDDIRSVGADRVLQVGQFEGGLETVSDLTDLVLTKAGGANDTESYELAMHFMSVYASMDCVEKRGKKGYFFMVADEHIPKQLEARHWNSMMDLKEGDEHYLAQDMSMDAVIANLREKFEVFIIYPTENALYKSYPHFIQSWRDAFGQDLLECDDSESIAAFIAGIIGMKEGVELTDMEARMKTASPDSASAISSACRSLAKYTGTITKSTSGTITSFTAEGDEGGELSEIK